MTSSGRSYLQGGRDAQRKMNDAKEIENLGVNALVQQQSNQ
jgi:hypothetical protein